MREEHSAGAIIFYSSSAEDILMLLLRKKDGLFDVPKGHIKEGESEKDAAIREIKEETGLEVSFLPYFKTSNRYYFDRGKEKILKINTFFLAEAKTLAVTLSSEHREYVWLSYNEAVAIVEFKPLVEVLKEAYNYIVKYVNMRILNAEYSKLSSSHVWKLSKSFVPGEGPLNASIMLIGQAPGATEDKERRPFVGRSGKLLDVVMKNVGIERSEVYITSVVQFFPPKNRIPKPSEVKLCLPFLERQIEIIKPKRIILLGNVAASALLGKAEITKIHGRVIEKNGRKYIATFHPAAVLRFKRLMREFVNDFKKASKCKAKTTIK